MDSGITSDEIGIDALIRYRKHERTTAAPKPVAKREQKPEP